MHQHDITSDGVARQKLAMKVSLVIGAMMFAGKTTAYVITGSAAILSDAAESVVHVAAVGFAAWSLWLSLRPGDPRHPYGYDKVTFFSAGFEGGMIVLAGLYIIYESVNKWLQGLVMENLAGGTLIVAGAAALNGALGGWLIRTGRRHHSLILTANGRHVLADCYTSIGVILGLVLTMITGWLPFDPIIAILIALNILRTGWHLIRESVSGLMDTAEPGLMETVERVLRTEARRHQVGFHGLRQRNAGNRLWIELHLLFPGGITLEKAHATATEIENAIEAALPLPAEVTTHLEPARDHDALHSRIH